MKRERLLSLTQVDKTKELRLAKKYLHKLLIFSPKRLKPQISALVLSSDLSKFDLFSCRYYMPYFNVNQKEVLSRLYTSLIPIKADFFEISEKNPDLYESLINCLF
jgi:hypothetical protein